MTDPQNPAQNPVQNPVQNPNPWQPPDSAQWQNPAGAYPVSPEPFAGHYQVSHVGQASFSMAPLSPVLPQEMAPARPATITAAMWIWLAGAVLSIAVVPVLMLGNIDFLVAQDGSVESLSDRQAAELGVTVTAVMAGFAMLVAAAPYVAFAIVLRNGQNWARILLTILGALGFLTMVSILLLSLAAEVWQVPAAMSVVVIGLTVAAVVLQFLPASNKYVR
ncbi:hypothetical protein ACIA8G_24855 [Lentzea sp. NPDC051213]|uniref:hypothetical protein n=1 Tax=Lentzea sp. NPDC051213 TaxID=3364126 RepID=UPI00379E4E1D